MPAPIPGVHHVTAIGSDPGRNLDFYTNTLGLRLIKRSVNQDDESVYHLFYGDAVGSPGTSMTVFPYPDASPGRVGTGQVSTTQFLVPGDSIEYWSDRLSDAGVDATGPTERFGDRVVHFEDPDGLPLELVASEDAPAGHPPDGPVPPEHAIRGFLGVTLSVDDGGPMATLLETMGFDERESLNGGGGRERERRRFVGNGDLGFVVDLLSEPDRSSGRPGAGTVHHVAFQVTTANQSEWREVLIQQGLRPTEIIDRKWFESVYVRTPSGILFEFATKEPGYTVDEDVEDLGERLVLPEWLEDRREEIEAGLPDLERPQAN
ncbi:MAG: VOC family protein [Halodesulfurarchaeum sp.]